MFCECVCRETWEDPSPGLKTKINHVFYTSAPLHMLFLLPISSSDALFPSLVYRAKTFSFRIQASSFLSLCLRTEWIISSSLLLLCSALLLSPASSTTVPSPTDIYLTWSTAWARRGEEWCIRISGWGSGGLQDWRIEHYNRFRGSNRINVSHEIFRFIEREPQFCIVLFSMSGLVVRQMCKQKRASCYKSIHKFKK